ncbi:MAG: hypothetical protein M3163_03560 [Actinomycetota bacterium]|nr:hypothetical protein [Actinomycetota bacterium]
MAEISEPAGRGFKVITVFTILFFLAVVAICIRTYDTGGEVTAAGAVVTAPASNAAAQAVTEAPVGAVATGGGGMAGDGPSAALPVFVALAAATMLAAGGMAVRRRTV